MQKLHRSQPAMSTENPSTRSQSKFGWNRPPTDSVVGPLMITAAGAGNANQLIPTVESIRNINYASVRGETALHRYTLRGRRDIVQLLLSKGALIEALNKSKCTPLHYAALKGHTSTYSGATFSREVRI